MCSARHSPGICPNPEDPPELVEDLHSRVTNVDAEKSSVIELNHADTAGNQMLLANMLKVLPLSTVKMLLQLALIV